jgi:hypothetical protein
MVGLLQDTVLAARDGGCYRRVEGPYAVLGLADEFL